VERCNQAWGARSDALHAYGLLLEVLVSVLLAVPPWLELLLGGVLLMLLLDCPLVSVPPPCC